MLWLTGISPESLCWLLLPWVRCSPTAVSLHSHSAVAICMCLFCFFWLSTLLCCLLRFLWSELLTSLQSPETHLCPSAAAHFLFCWIAKLKWTLRALADFYGAYLIKNNILHCLTENVAWIIFSTVPLYHSAKCVTEKGFILTHAC